MSMIDSYQRNIERKRNELTRLTNDRVKIIKKISNLTSKINSASDMISRTKNESTYRSKLREIQQKEKEHARESIKLADIERKIAAKHKDLAKEQEKLAKEETREFDKQAKETKKQTDVYTQQISQFSNVFNNHEGRLSMLETLPETIVVLFLASNPLDQNQLRLDEEARAIKEMIRKSENRDSVKFETCWAVRPLDILQAVNECKPTIVHFSGHGSANGDLVFQGEFGKTKMVSKEAIAQMLVASSESIRLMFFNACHSKSQAETVVNHIHAAILSVYQSFQQAKAALMLKSISEEHKPELFTHDDVDAREMFIVETTNAPPYA
ncbi:hypothetical protein ES708_27244 [subsurface metagenome]